MESGWGRAWLGGTLAASGWFRAPIRAPGQAPSGAGGATMDRTMSALVRLANRLGRSARPDLGAIRRQYAGAPALTGLVPDRSVRTKELRIAGRPARRYEPAAPAAADLLFFHGGGFIMGGLDTHDALCRRLATRAGLRVTAIDYRLAPEHPFPAAHDDAAAAWDAVREAGGRWLVGGDSAGANLAAGLARTGGAALQMLLYPVVDMRQVEGAYPSLDTFGTGFLLTSEGMAECLRLLLPGGEGADDPLLSPIRADLSCAAPAVIVAAGFDPLRDQAVAYAAALQTAGVRAYLLEERALPHGFADFAGVVPEARRAVDRVADAVRTALEEGRG